MYLYQHLYLYDTDTAGTISGRGGGSHGSGVVRKLGHVSRGSTWRGRCLCWVCGVVWGQSKDLYEEGVMDEWTQPAMSGEVVLTPPLPIPFPIPIMSLMFFSTPLFSVSLISLHSALRVLNLMKLLHPRNLTGLTIVRLVSSLPVTVHTSQFLLGLWTILTLTFTYLRSACSLQPTSAIMKTYRRSTQTQTRFLSYCLSTNHSCWYSHVW